MSHIRANIFVSQRREQTFIFVLILFRKLMPKSGKSSIYHRYRDVYEHICLTAFFNVRRQDKIQLLKYSPEYLVQLHVEEFGQSNDKVV